MLRFASLLLTLTIASHASAQLYWNVVLEQNGDVTVNLNDPEAAAVTHITIAGDSIAADQAAIVTADLDHPDAFWAVHVDWTDINGDVQRSSLLAPAPVPDMDGAMMRPRWSADQVAPQPLAADGPYAHFRVDLSGEAGPRLHMVQTGELQPKPLEHAPGDVNADWSVDVYDLLRVIHSWSPMCDPEEPCQGDADFDGDVDTSDILQVLSHFNEDPPSQQPLDGGGADAIDDSHVAWTWAPVTREDATNLTSMIWAPSWRTPEEVAEDSLTRPEGHRVIFFFANIVNDLTTHPDDAYITVDAETGAQIMTPSPWIDHGVAEVRARLTDWVSRFVAAGGDLDAVIVDNETSLGVHRFFTGDSDAWTPVMSDSRFPALESDLGFSALHDIAWGTEYATIWNSVMGQRFDEALDESVFDVVRNAFPDAMCSNYMSFTQSANNPSLDLHGHSTYRQSTSCGTHDARAFYGRMTQWLGAATHPTYAGGGTLGEDAWGALLISIHRMRATGQSTDRGMMAWISNQDWPGDPGAVSQFVGSAYYDELILQLGMHGVSRFIYWLPHNVFNDDPEFNNSPDDQSRVDALMRSLSDRIGPNAVQAATSQVSFNELVLGSSVTRDGTVVWRLSFRDDVTGVEVRFEDGETVYLQPDPGTHGAWFEHDAGRALTLNAIQSGPLLTGVTVADP